MQFPLLFLPPSPACSLAFTMRFTSMYLPNTVLGQLCRLAYAILMLHMLPTSDRTPGLPRTLRKGARGVGLSSTLAHCIAAGSYTGTLPFCSLGRWPGAYPMPFRATMQPQQGYWLISRILSQALGGQPSVSTCANAPDCSVPAFQLSLLVHRCVLPGLLSCFQSSSAYPTACTCLPLGIPDERPPLPCVRTFWPARAQHPPQPAQTPRRRPLPDTEAAPEAEHCQDCQHAAGAPERADGEHGAHAANA